MSVKILLYNIFVKYSLLMYCISYVLKVNESKKVEPTFSPMHYYYILLFLYIILELIRLFYNYQLLNKVLLLKSSIFSYYNLSRCLSTDFKIYFNFCPIFLKYIL